MLYSVRMVKCKRVCISIQTWKITVPMGRKQTSPSILEFMSLVFFLFCCNTMLPFHTIYAENSINISVDSNVGMDVYHVFILDCFCFIDQFTLQILSTAESMVVINSELVSSTIL